MVSTTKGVDVPRESHVEFMARINRDRAVRRERGRCFDAVMAEAVQMRGHDDAHAALMRVAEKIHNGGPTIKEAP